MSVSLMELFVLVVGPVAPGGGDVLPPERAGQRGPLCRRATLVVGDLARAEDRLQLEKVRRRRVDFVTR